MLRKGQGAACLEFRPRQDALPVDRGPWSSLYVRGQCVTVLPSERAGLREDSLNTSFLGRYSAHIFILLLY